MTQSDNVLPGSTELQPAPSDSRAADPEEVTRALAELDMNDTASILYFGSRAQEQLTEVSDTMLEGVRNKDVGPAGNALGEMVSTLRGFDVRRLDPSKERKLVDRLLGAPKPLARFLQSYEKVRRQIDAIGDQLERHKGELMVDIASLDRLYTATLGYFHHLAAYIEAGDRKLRELDAQLVPALERDVETTGDVLKAQQLRDVRAARDDLERRVHDLKLTRQVAMQSLPSIRLVQQNDKSLVNKITSVLANTVPLWRTQLAQAVTILRSRDAGTTLREATDLTNELLTANADNLRQANAEVRREVERGIFDIEAVKKANEQLIATIEESLQIADEAKRRRADAEHELQTCETELRNALAAARARVTASPKN